MLKTKLRKKLRLFWEKGFAKGELQTSIRYKKSMDQLSREHQKHISDLLKAHSLDIRIIEKGYLLKQARLDKKSKRLDDLMSEWEENIYQVREISSQAREVLARIKQIMYQDRKTLASAMDDEKTLEMLQLSLNNLVQKQNSLPQGNRV